MPFPKEIYNALPNPPDGWTWIALYALIEQSDVMGNELNIERDYEVGGIKTSEKIRKEDLQLYAYEESLTLIHYLADIIVRGRRVKDKEWIKEIIE